MKKYLSILFLTFVCIVICQTTLKAQLAQTRVTITVVDISDVAMPGVTVAILNTSCGAVTGVDGKVTIDCPTNSTLQFSFIDYLTQEIELRGSTSIKVVMHATDIADLSIKCSFKPILDYLNYITSCKVSYIMIT